MDWDRILLFIVIVVAGFIIVTLYRRNQLLTRMVSNQQRYVELEPSHLAGPQANNPMGTIVYQSAIPNYEEGSEGSGTA
jgi:hypothetical protein